MAKAPTDIRSLARAHTDTALNVLRGIMTNDEAPMPARVAAATYLLDRGWGRAVQALEVTQIEKTVIRSPSVSETAKDWAADHVPEGHTEH